jgi:hypothetical protein
MTLELKLAFSIGDRQRIMTLLPDSLECLTAPPDLYKSYCEQLADLVIGFLTLLCQIAASSDRKADILEVGRGFAKKQRHIELEASIDTLALKV